MDIIFRTQGRVARGVNKIRGLRDLDTGETPTTHEAFTLIALFATDEWRSVSFLNLQENVIVLERQAQYVVSNDEVFKLELKRRFKHYYFYHADKVTDDAVLMAARHNQSS